MKNSCVENVRNNFLIFLRAAHVQKVNITKVILLHQNSKRDWLLPLPPPTPKKLTS